VKSVIKLAAGAILSVLTSGYVTQAETNLPIQIGPRTIATNPTPVYFRNAFFVPPAFAAASVPQSPVEPAISETLCLHVAVRSPT